MAHGWRGRAAGIGAAVAVCTGLGGCMNDDKKPIAPPAAKGMTATPPASVRTGSPGATGPAAQWGQAGTPMPRTPSAGGFAGTPGSITTAPNPYNTGEINRPAVPGNYGTGAPLPGMSPVAPSVGPAAGTTTGSQYYTPPSPPADGLPVVGSAPGLPNSRAPEMPSVQMSSVGALPPPPPIVPGHPGVGPAVDYTPAAPTAPTAPLPPIGSAPYAPR